MYINIKISYALVHFDQQFALDTVKLPAAGGPIALCTEVL